MRLVILFSLFVWLLPAFAQEVSLLTSRSESHNVRAEMIRRETKELRLSTFLFELDDFGEETLGLLADAARRGVKVKINIDGLFKVNMSGSMGFDPRVLAKNHALLTALEQAGVEVKIFNPVFRNMPSINYRNHMKSLIGSDFMIVGDRNMTMDYFKRKSDNNYISMDVLVKGDQVDEAIKHYDEVYKSSQMKNNVGFVSVTELDKARKELNQWMEKATKNSFSTNMKLNRPMQTPEYVKYYADSPGGMMSKNPDGLHAKILDMINRSKTSLEFTNPYVLVTPETKKALQAAIDRGVKITINSNSAISTDSHLMAMAWDLRKHDLVKMGIEVNELKPGHYVHAKTIIMDKEEVFVGSFNLDPRSQNLNLENGVFIKDKTSAQKLINYNRRVVKNFMQKVEAENPKNLPATERMNNCVKKGLRKFVTSIVFPIL